jgi:cytochrome c
MYKLENTNMLKKTIVGLSASLALALGANAAQLNYIVQPGDTIGSIAEKHGIKNINRIKVPSGDLSKIFPGDRVTSYEVAVDGAVKYPTTDMYTKYHVNDNAPKVKWNKGREATQNEINAWNIDVMPHDEATTPKFDKKHGKVVMEDGQPKKAEGDAAWGEELYEKLCLMCHGDFGAGGKGYPPLSGGVGTSTLTNQLMNPAHPEPNTEPPSKVIGAYWPYVSTLFWYIQDAMPFPKPKSLSNSETYALTAYMLMINEVEYEGEVIDEDFVLDAEKMLKIKLPNEDGFYPQVDTPEDPKQGVRNMTNYLSNPQNYGAGTRCMTDCIKEDISELTLRIKNELNDFHPPASTVRELPPKKDSGGKAHPGKEGYEQTFSCAACHDNAAIGAPVIGNKEAWVRVLEKGLDAVYTNGINGIGGMPPKGGAAISDEEFKVIVDYMIEASK